MLSMVPLYNFLRIWGPMPNLFSLLREKMFCHALFTTVLVCFDYGRSLVISQTLNPLHYSPVDVNGCLFSQPFPVVCSFVLLTLRERLFSWHHTASSLSFSL
jgi:hypothetical protein